MRVVPSFFLHHQPYFGHHPGIVQGAVRLLPHSGDTIRVSCGKPVMSLLSDKVPIDRLQFVISQVREAVPAHFEGADVRTVEFCSQQFVLAA
jgi:hypothetical protein